MEIVLSTFPSREAASEAARTLVSERLAACANIAEVSSIYAWRGKIEEGPEFLCVFKTAPDKCGALERRIAELHPYEVPEIARIGASFNGPYSRWLAESTS